MLIVYGYLNCIILDIYVIGVGNLINWCWIVSVKVVSVYSYCIYFDEICIYWVRLMLEC